MTKQTSPDPDGTGPLLAASAYRSLDSLGNVLNSRNDTSTGTTLAYDGRFRAISSTDSEAAATLFKYNVYGQTTQVEDAKQNKTTFDYDRLNRQFKETKIGYGSRTSTLDGVGNVQSYVDRNGRTTLFEYNKLYDVAKETWVNPAEGNGVTNYTYDATGRLVSAADNKGNSNVFNYDINDRVDTERVFIAGVSPYVGEVKLDNDYNQRGLRTKVSTTIGTTADAVNDYAYDNRNMMTSVKQSGANVTDKLVNFTYNASGQLDTINRFKTLTPQSLVASSKYQYDGAGRVQVITHSKTAISTGWNGTDVSTTTTDPILAAYFLKYDQSNRVTSFASRFDGFSTAYGYDTRDQLTGATTTPLAGATVTFTPPVENYVFDKTGNRTNGGTSTSANETHNRVQNDGTNTYLYDNEGNQISRTNNSTGEVTTYSYDYRNRLIKVASPGKVVSYQYDAFDRRIRKLVDDGGNGSIDSRTAWVWDGNQVIFQFKDSDGEGILPFKLTNRYLYGDIVDLILADEQVGVPGTGGGSVGMPMSFPIGSTGSVSTEGLYRILWPLSDHLGTVRDLVDSNGTRLEHRVYDSFGKLLVETEDFTSGNTGSTGGSLGMPVGGGGGGGTTTDAIDSIFGYTGREWDKDVKLQFNRARWYDPASGRWISQDPIGFRAGDANLYRYVGNRPTTYTDPSGLRGWEIGGLTPGQWTYATGVLFYEWGANGCRAVHGIASGSAGRSMGERAVAMSQNQSGQQFDGDAGDWLRFSNQMAREMTGANAIAEGGVGVDMAEYRELDAWERGTRISSGTGAMAGTAAGGLGLAGKAGIGIGNVKVPFTPNMPSFPLPPWMRPTNGSTSGATLGEIASVSEDALVNIGSQARDIVLPPGGRSYWFRFGDIKHLTIDQVRTLVGQMASAGTREGSRVIRVAKKGTEGKSVPCTDGYFEYVIDGAVDVSESISLP